jgi:hypothetical protein
MPCGAGQKKKKQIAEAIQKKGMPKDSAFAIATTMVERTAKKKKKK